MPQGGTAHLVESTREHMVIWWGPAAGSYPLSHMAAVSGGGRLQDRAREWESRGGGKKHKGGKAG